MSKNFFKSKKRWIRANTEQEYCDKLAKLFEGNTSQQEQDKLKHPFKDYARNWFEVYKKPSTAEATINLYSYLLRNFIYPVLENMALEDIATDHVQMILNNAHNKSKETKGKIMQVLNQILGAAIEDDIIAKIQRNPSGSR